jgi:DNA-binding NtrC family response regulator
MPARTVVVLDETGTSESVARALNEAGHEAVALADSMIALNALESASRIELLITCLHFAPGNPNGIALSRMARIKRPGIKVIFVGSADLASYTAGLGEFMQTPVSVAEIVNHARQVLLNVAEGGTEHPIHVSQGDPLPSAPLEGSGGERQQARN